MICKKEIINAGLTLVHMREDGVANKSYTLEEIKKLLAQEEEEWRRKKNVGYTLRSRRKYVTNSDTQSARLLYIWFAVITF